MLEIDPNLSGHVSLVGAGPGAEDLLTLRAQRALQEADVIVYDRLVPEAVVAQGRRDARRIYVGKAKGDHAVSQEEINALLVREAQKGNRVVRLKSGDPLIFGRAGEEMAALRAAGISFDVVPGITAAFAAAAENEIPLTLRDTASALVFATGHDADGDTLPGWAGLALSGATVAVYMGRTVAAKVAARLIEAGLAAATPVAVIENASRPDRRAYAGRLDELGADRRPARADRAGADHHRRGGRGRARSRTEAGGARRACGVDRAGREMFKAAKAGPQKAITANRLDDGLRRLPRRERRAGRIDDRRGAVRLATGPTSTRRLAYAQGAARCADRRRALCRSTSTIVDDKPVPARIRERIRAEGPTVVYGEAEYAREAPLQRR